MLLDVDTSYNRLRRRSSEHLSFNIYYWNKEIKLYLLARLVLPSSFNVKDKDFLLKKMLLSV